MIALLRKEFQLASDVIAGACVLLAASFPLAFAGVAMQGVTPFPWISALAGGCILNQYTMVLTGVLLGAAAFAREREDGNVHFLAILPLPLSRQFVAKAVAVLLIWFGLWAVNALALAAVSQGAGQGAAALAPYLARMFNVTVLSFAALGFGCLAGSRIDSVTGGAIAGAAALLLVAVLRSFWIAPTDAPFFSPPFLISLGALGAAGLAEAARRFSAGAGSRSRFQPRSAVARNVGALRFGGGANAALLWKDVRLMRVALTAGLLLLALPFVAAGGNALLSGGAALNFRVASLLVMALGWVVLPLWSAGALAGEWGPSTHQFLACLPVSARRVVSVKLVVAGAPAALVIFAGIAVFLLSQKYIPGEPALRASMSWDEFGASHFLGGAVAYACALPVTFAVSWYLAARLRRKVVAIVLGAVSGPLAMAAWAVTSAPEGFVAEYFLPLQAAGIHAVTLSALSALLLALGVRGAVHVELP